MISLLDDEDSEVFTHIEGKIMQLGQDVIPLLEEEWENNFSPVAQRRIEDLIHGLQYEQLNQRLANWVDEGGKDLLEGVWLVATYQYPDTDLEQLRKDFEQLFYEAWMEFKVGLHPYDQIKVLNNAIFNKLRFRANTKNFHSPQNSMIHRVLESRRGNPIALCIIYMLVAQKLKLPVYGVNLPNLFILTYKNQDQHFYINAFNRGLVFSKSDIEQYLSHLNLPHNKAFFEPCDHITIVARVLRNLHNSFEKLGEHQRAEEIKVLLRNFPAPR